MQTIRQMKISSFSALFAIFRSRSAEVHFSPIKCPFWPARSADPDAILRAIHDRFPRAGTATRSRYDSRTQKREPLAGSANRCQSHVAKIPNSIFAVLSRSSPLLPR